jgi:hypothetical protein
MYISLEVIESWPVPNYTDPIKRGPSVIVVNIVFYILVLVVVSLRTYTRLRISRVFGLDDVFILIAFVGFQSPSSYPRLIFFGSFQQQRLLSLL